MEVVSGDGRPIIRIEQGQRRELGRGYYLDSSDRAVSRRQLSCCIPSYEDNRDIRLQFEVIGQNPIYVSNDGEVKIFRRHERGEMQSGDMFCVSAKDPVWYTLRWTGNRDECVRQNVAQTELGRSFESIAGKLGEENFHLEGIDTSDIDPVKEFGFVLRDHEFDSFPKKKVFDPKNWDWFLEEASKDGEDDGGDKVKCQHKMKRKKVTEKDEEEWTGESEDDKDIVQKSTNSRRPKYITRSKDPGSKDASNSKITAREKRREVDEYDEDDETLGGGFIVDDEILEDDEEIGDDENEEQDEEDYENDE